MTPNHVITEEILKIAELSEREAKDSLDQYDAIADWHLNIKPRLDAIDRRNAWKRRAMWTLAAMGLAASYYGPQWWAR